MTICPRCKTGAPLTATYKVGRATVACCATCEEGLAKKRAYMSARKAKNAEKNRRWSKNWATENSEKRNAYSREYSRGIWRTWHNEYRRGRKEIRAEEARNRHAKDPEASRARKRAHYEKNKERLLHYRSEYLKNNPWFNRAAASRQRALILQRTVGWASRDAIKQFYKNCPPGMVVDHIIPLRGKTVCGLHIVSNLQYLTFKENSKKSNHLIEEMLVMNA